MSTDESGRAQGASDLHERIKELTLLLMYLTSWEENPYAGTHGLSAKIKRQMTPEQLAATCRACWKGYDFDILNELTDEGFVEAGGSRKTAYFNLEGEQRALELMKRYRIPMDN